LSARRWATSWPIDGLKALACVVVGIMLYLAMRFEWKFAVAAIIANLHDVVIILGFFAFFQWEFSLPVLAAVLAVLGYSVNESVVIFDRIRENFRRYRKMNTVEIIDNAITSTISRTIITHGCTQLMVLSMLLFGGATLALLCAGADHRHFVRHLLVRSLWPQPLPCGWASSAKT
jgi:preprotein translocase subunit SecF